MRGNSLAARANIVSFDEAKASSRSRAARRPSPDRFDNRRLEDTGKLRMPTSRRDSRTNTRADHIQVRTLEESFRQLDAQEDRQADFAEESSSQALDKRERRRRERSKKRADRMFSKQFAAEGATSGSDEGAPRAALYEGKMGASHRKSARMQRSSSAEAQTAKVNPAGWFSNVRVSPRLLKIGTALLCLVLVGVFLYTPAKQYYQAQREHDRLAAEYAVLEQRNQALDSQNTSLSSNAGMEDAVRQKYGYVVDGDKTAVVTGLSETTTDSSRDGEDIEANVLSSAVKAPEEWYTPYLDAFFGVL